MTDNERELLKISNSNNNLLLELYKKQMENSEKIDDLSFLLNLRDSEKVWISTTFNLVSFEALLSLLSYSFTNLNRTQCASAFAGVTLGTILYCYKKYKEEIQDQEKIKKLLLEKYDISEITYYTKLELDNLINEQSEIKNIIKQTIIKEEEIRDELDKKVKKLSK